MKIANNDLKKLVRSQWGWKTYLSISIFILLLVLTAIDLKLDFVSVVINSWKYTIDLFGRLFPPDISDLKLLLLSMVETVEIAFWGTFLAITISIPFGIFSSRNIAPHPLIYFAARVVTILFRAVPEFILAMFLVICVGFGPMSGVFALGLHTMGFLAKFYAEEIGRAHV